jgi:hypothetical protein
MRSRYPTDDELRGVFEEELGSAVAGGPLRTDTGLDMETDEALVAIAMAYPAVSDALVAEARRAFAGQLDGSNAAARRADLDRLIDDYNRRRP